MTIDRDAELILERLHASDTAFAAVPAQRLVDECSVDTDAAGVSLTWSSPRASPLTIAATLGVGTEVERLGFVLGEGPQVSATASTRIILRASLTDSSEEWPAFTLEALRLGVRAVFAFPLRLGAISVGVLTICRDQAGSLDEKRLAAALAYAAAATALLLEPPRGSADGHLPAVLEDPFILQAEVHQATGMVAAQLAVDLDVALSLLRAHAYSSSQPLNTIARAVIARTLHIT